MQHRLTATLLAIATCNLIAAAEPPALDTRTLVLRPHDFSLGSSYFEGSGAALANATLFALRDIGAHPQASRFSSLANARDDAKEQSCPLILDPALTRWDLRGKKRLLEVRLVWLDAVNGNEIARCAQQHPLPEKDPENITPLLRDAVRGCAQQLFNVAAAPSVPELQLAIVPRALVLGPDPLSATLPDTEGDTALAAIAAKVLERGGVKTTILTTPPTTLLSLLSIGQAQAGKTRDGAPRITVRAELTLGPHTIAKAVEVVLNDRLDGGPALRTRVVERVLAALLAALAAPSASSPIPAAALTAIPTHDPLDAKLTDLAVTAARVAKVQDPLTAKRELEYSPSLRWYRLSISERGVVDEVVPLIADPPLTDNERTALAALHFAPCTIETRATVCRQLWPAL